MFPINVSLFPNSGKSKYLVWRGRLIGRADIRNGTDPCAGAVRYTPAAFDYMDYERISTISIKAHTSYTIRNLCCIVT